MKHLKIPYEDLLKMPTYERRFFLSMLMKEGEKRQEELENQSSTTSNGKGSRTKKISGEMLKMGLKNGSIPN